SVVDQSLPVDGTRVDAAHVGITRDVVEIVESKDSAGERLKKAHPLGLAVVFLAVFLDRKGHVFGPELLARPKRTARAPAQLLDHFAQMLLNDRLAEILVGEIVVREKVVVEKMAERSVADI